ncbi:MAG TPA: kelch repeat-containing protein [Terracidiphilus sp.]|jgi:hypothetical protein
MNAQSSNQWSPSGQMVQARTGAAAVSLSDGKILITGGADSNGVPQASTEIFDPSTGQFSQAAPMNVPRADHAAIALTTGDVLVTGGLTTGGGYSDTAEILNAQTGSWTLLEASLGTGLAKHAMAALSDGNVLIVGGESTGGPVLSLLLFKMSDQSMSAAGSLMTARTDAAAAATPDGRVLIAGGTDINGTVLSSTEVFAYSPDTLNGTMSAGPNMSSPRTKASATTTYDGVALIGGSNGSSNLGTAEIFSQWTNTLRVVSGATPKSGHIAALLPKNGSILTMGGTGGTAVDLLQPWANNLAGAFIAGSASTSDRTSGIASPGSLGTLLGAGGTGSSANSAELYRFPTIATDQPDYAPGTTVVMTGAGFQAGESVKLYMREWVNKMLVDPPDYQVTSDASGHFSLSDYAPTITDVGARYHLTAVGTNSGLQAQTIFTDSKPNTVTIGAQNPNPVHAGASTQYVITTGFNGNGNSCTVDLSITGLPSGASGTFNPATFSSTGADVASTLSIDTTSNTVANSYAFTVTATGRTGCQTPLTATKNGTLVVAAPTPTTLAVSSASGTFGGTVNLSATLTVTAGGAPVGSQTVSFKLNGANVGTATTDGSGTATLSNVSLSGISAGTYASGVSASFTAGSGFAGSAGSATLTVAPVQVTLTAGTYSGTYDGSSHAFSGCSSSVPSMVTCTNSPSGLVGPDVGSGTVTPTPAFAQGTASDYTITSNNGSWSITTLAVTLTGGSFSGTYDGATHALSACSSSQATFVTCTNSPAGPVGPEVGSASVVPTPVYGKGAAIDYSLTISNGSWSITTLAVTLTAGSYSGVYDGDTHALSACSSNQSGFVTCANNPAGPVGPDVNTAVVSPTPSFVHGNASDYTITSNNGSWSITPLAVSVTAGNYSGTYDGDPHAPSACKSTYAGVSCANDPASVGPDVSSGAVAPTASIITGIAGDYTITKTSGAYSITPLALTLTAGSYSGIYDGSSHPLSACSTTQSAFVTCNNSPGGSVGPDVTSGAVSPTAAYVKGSAIDYNITSNNGAYSITPLAVTVTAGSYNGTYDGDQHAPSACKSTYAGVSCANDPASVGPDVSSGAVAPVPTIVTGIAADYTITKINGAYSITPLALALTAGSYSGTYDGNSHALSACTSTQPSFVTCNNNPAGPVGPDVTSGTVSPTASYVKGSAIDYNITSNNGAYSITALAVTVTGGSYSGIYDGDPHAPLACKTTYAGVSCANDPASVGPDVSSGVVSPVPTIVTGIPADYVITKENGNWSITPLAVTLSAGGYSGVYDGSPHSISACSSSQSGFVTCTNDPAGPVGPDVGSETVKPVPVFGKGSSIDFNITSNNNSWSITALPVTVTAGTYSGTYDGVAHSPFACSSSYAGVSCSNDPASVGPDVSSGAVAPVSSIVSGIAADYIITPKNGSWSISPLALTLNAGGYTGVYDGSSHALSACASTVPGFVSCTNSPAGPVGPDVGSAAVAPVTAFEKGSSIDYMITSNNGSWSITPLGVTVTGGSYTSIYDGAPHPPTACTSSYAGVSCANSPGSIGPDVGSGSITATPAIVSGIAADYVTTTKDGSWSISPLTVTVTAGSYSGTYDGNPRSPSVCTSSYAGVNCANSPSSVGPDVGSGSVAATSAIVSGIAADYTITPVSGSWSISPLTVSVTGGNYNATYDGNAHSPSQCASTFAGVSCTSSPASIGPDVGSGVISPTSNILSGIPADYNITPKDGSWSISQLAVTVTAGNYSGVYDGNSHALSACSSTQEAFVSCANNPAGPVGPDVGSTQVIPVVSYLKGNPGDYALATNSASWSIMALPVTLTAGRYTGTFDGVSHALSACTSSSPTLVTCTNSPTGPVGPGAGSSTVSPTTMYVKGTSADYILTLTNASWSITKAQPAFSGLTNQSITYGTSSITLSGVIAAPGSVYPPSGETVSIVINGSTVQAPIGSNGMFSITIDSHAIPVSVNLYTVTYNYAGDANFFGAPMGSTTLSVKYASAGVCGGDLGHTILQPINASGTSVFNSKSTSPAKFRVCDANGVSVGTPGVVKSFVLYQILNGTTTTVNESVDSTTPDTTFRWDPTAQQWIFNISNKNLGPANQTYFFLITLNDGTSIPFSYGLK